MILTNHMITIQDFIYSGATVERLKELERQKFCTLTEYRITHNSAEFQVRVAEYDSLKIILSGLPFKVMNEILIEKIRILDLAAAGCATKEEFERADYYSKESLIADKIRKLTIFNVFCRLMMYLTPALAIFCKDFSYLFLTAAGFTGVLYVNKRKIELLNQNL